MPDALPKTEDMSTEKEAESRKQIGTHGAIDFTELENMLGALDDDAIEMMDMFQTMTEPLMADLKSAHDSKNWHQFSEIGHSLKGSARSIGAVTLGNTCEDIEDNGKSAKDMKRTTMLNHAIRAFDEVKAHIQFVKDNGF